VGTPSETRGGPERGGQRGRHDRRVHEVGLTVAPHRMHPTVLRAAKSPNPIHPVLVYPHIHPTHPDAIQCRDKWGIGVSLKALQRGHRPAAEERRVRQRFKCGAGEVARARSDRAQRHLAAEIEGIIRGGGQDGEGTAPECGIWTEGAGGHGGRRRSIVHISRRGRIG
jgi:hypothetical protein